MGNSNSTDPFEKAAAEVFGREHLVDIGMFSKTQDVPSAFLPGLQSFGTARAVAIVLQSVAAGSLLSTSMLNEMVRSRRQVNDSDGDSGSGGLPAEWSDLLHLDGFDDWGLGMQLVSSESWSGQNAESSIAQGAAPSKKAWGHLSQSGSAALVLPGKHPKALALLVNMMDGANTRRISRAVLQLLEKHSCVE